MKKIEKKNIFVIEDIHVNRPRYVGPWIIGYVIAETVHDAAKLLGRRAGPMEPCQFTGDIVHWLSPINNESDKIYRLKEIYPLEESILYSKIINTKHKDDVEDDDINIIKKET